MVTSKRTLAFFAFSPVFHTRPGALAAVFLGAVACSAPALAQSASPYGQGATVHRVQSYSSSGGGLFSTLFGGGSRSRRGRYDTYNYGGPPNAEKYGAAPRRSYGRYRTLCVRTCDGYYFPISFSTTRAGFGRDARQCQSSCSAPAKLFVYRNPGADVEHMVSLDGERYANMENAFRYREEYVETCRCKPEPWTSAAKEMYERRAKGEENPDAVTTAQNQAGGEPVADPAASAAQWRTRNRVQRAPRRRERKVDPAYRGRWWAGSW